MTPTEAELMMFHRASLDAAMKRLRRFGDAHPDPFDASQRRELESLQRCVARARRQIGDQHIAEADLALVIEEAGADDEQAERLEPQRELAQNLYDAKMALADALEYFGAAMDCYLQLEDRPPQLLRKRQAA
jgi:hypothetical protein